MSTRRAYPSDVSDEEWAFVAPYLTVLPEDAGQRRYPLREVFNGLRYLIQSGAPWRMIPHALPPWIIVYQPTRRWLEAGAFDALVADLRLLVRLQAGRTGQPSAVLLDSRTIQSTPESGARAGYDGHKRRKGSTVHAAVDTLGQLLALQVTSANELDRAQVARLAQAVQEARGEHVTVAFVDQGYTGPQPAAAAQAVGIELQVVKLPTARQGFVLLPRRWVVERRFAWASRFRRLARDYERLPTMLAGLHFAAFACLMLHQFIHTLSP
jgi:transposase